jgi:hypothetical protein
MVINTLHILAIGRNAAIMQVVERLINGHPHWKGKAVATDEEAVAALQEEKYHIALLCAGIGMEEEQTLKDKWRALDPSLVVVRHYGGGSGLLENEILTVLDQHNIRILQ